MAAIDNAQQGTMRRILRLMADKRASDVLSLMHI